MTCWPWYRSSRAPAGSSPAGKTVRPMRAGGSWRPATGASTPPLWPCWPGSVFSSSEDRRSGHERVKGGKRLHPESILFHQQLMAAARHDEMGTGPQPDSKFIDRGCRDDLVVAGRDDQHRLADL